MTIKLTLESISSSEVELDSWRPLESEDVFLCLDIEIGYLGGNGGTNMFYVTLATPEGLLKHRDSPMLVKNRTLVISEYNYNLVKKEIDSILEDSARDTWNNSCIILQRYFQWEYEDYIVET